MFPVSWSHPVALSESSARTMPLKARNGDVFFIVHHAYNYTVQDTIALAEAGGKQVSMNFAIGPVTARAESPIYCVGVVPEDRRAFTTASSIDDKALTTEVSNLDLNLPYPVAQAAKEILAQIAAYMHLEYGMPLDRWHVCDHSEVYERGWGSYATACCGPDLRNSLDWIVARAIEITGSINKRGKTMPVLIRNLDNTGKPTGGAHLIGDGGKAKFMLTNSQEFKSLENGMGALGLVSDAYVFVIEQIRKSWAEVSPVSGGGLSPEEIEQLGNSIASQVDGFTDADMEKLLKASADETAKILAAIDKVDENTLATFGLQRIPAAK